MSFFKYPEYVDKLIKVHFHVMKQHKNYINILITTSFVIFVIEVWKLS